MNIIKLLIDDFHMVEFHKSSRVTSNISCMTCDTVFSIYFSTLAKIKIFIRNFSRKINGTLLFIQIKSHYDKYSHRNCTSYPVSDNAYAYYKEV